MLDNDVNAVFKGVVIIIVIAIILMALLGIIDAKLAADMVMLWI